MTLMVLLFAMLLTLNDKVFGIRISEKKCEDYRQMFSPTPGQFEESTEYNFMVRILNATHYCNGILISENFVLSSVVETIENYRSYGHYVVIGDTTCSRCQIFDVVEIFIHDGFNARIALYKLNGLADIDKFVRPACLPKVESIISNDDLYEIGWTGGWFDGGLNKVKMDEVSNEHCGKEYQFYRRQIYVRGLADKSIFCARPKASEYNICNGYNSAALLNEDGDNATNEVLGIALRAFQCDQYNTPAVYVRVSKYVDWIESIVWPSEIKANTNSTTKPFISLVNKSMESDLPKSSDAKAEPNKLVNMLMERNLTDGMDYLAGVYKILKELMESDAEEIDSTDASLGHKKISKKSRIA